MHIVRGGITRDDARLRGRRRNLASTSEAEVSGRRYPRQIQLINTRVYVAPFFAESGLLDSFGTERPRLRLDLSAKYPLIMPVVRVRRKKNAPIRKNKSRLNWKTNKLWGVECKFEKFEEEELVNKIWRNVIGIIKEF